MLGGRNQEMGGYAPAQSAPQPSYQSRPAQSAPAPQAEPPMDAFDDNIPFWVTYNLNMMKGLKLCQTFFYNIKSGHF